MNGLPKDRALSIEEISRAMEACSANAQELIKEATLLVEASHKARAFFLYHTACEELAKFFIFLTAGKRIAQGNPPNWKRFWQRLRSHESKLAHIEVRARVPSGNELSKEDELVLSGLDLLSSYGALPRNSTLYVDLDPKQTFCKPSDIDWGFALPSLEALSRHLLSSAEQIGESNEAILREIHRVNSDEMREHALKTLTHVVARLRAAGIEKDEVLRQLEKHLR